MVSFNLDAFTSYGHEQGEKPRFPRPPLSPTRPRSIAFCERGSANRIQIGDASTVFWADATNAETAKEAEDIFSALLNTVDENSEAKKVRAILESVRMGRAPADFTPDLPDKVRFHVLGLAPNAARLSVRFYIEDDFGRIAANFLAHVERLRIEPPPRAENPALWKYLAETAARGKSENVPPNLAGEFLRAILTGMPYPRNLLAVLLMRLRTDKDVNALRVSLLKAILFEKPFASSVNKFTNGGFRVAQSAKQRSRLSARPAVRFLRICPDASAWPQGQRDDPRSVLRHRLGHAASGFSNLATQAESPSLALAQGRPGLAVNLDRSIGKIFELADADKLFVPTLTAQRQALFAVGYYHQRNSFYRSKEALKDDATVTNSQE